MALGKIFGRRTHACVFVDVDAAKSHVLGQIVGVWNPGFRILGTLYM
jgi:hypothetical protein